jgi:phage host-nuclease inhibitor protein Gam
MAPRENVVDGPTITDWGLADAAIGHIREHTALADKLEAEKELFIKRIKDEYDPKIKDRRASAATCAKALKEFAEAHRAEFGATKSRQLSNGVIGFRQGTGTLETLKKMTWAKVLLTIRASRAWAAKYLRVKEEVNKAAILDAIRAGALKPADAQKMGVYMDVSEAFFYETNSEPAAAIPAAKAG